MSDREPAVLVCEDGTRWPGHAWGARPPAADGGQGLGEVVFTTAMTGYQETLTDPSYAGQVVVATFPHIGNTGVNDEDAESRRMWPRGYVVRDPARRSSSWRATGSLADALAADGVVGLRDVDTRALTRHLREVGVMRAGIGHPDDEGLLGRVRASPSMLGADLARLVSTPEPYVVPAVGERRYVVAALDCGIKARTPWHLAARGCEVHVLPAATTAEQLLAIDPDGVFVSNGPGDPAAATYAVDALAGVLGRVPVFGICLGHQLLGRAVGLSTYKLGYGHHGINQPVLDRATGTIAVTSHNHGFAVAAPPERVTDTPFGRVEVSHLACNDGVVEGLRCLDAAAFSVQYHPEAAAGPHDAAGLFDAFTSLMAQHRASALTGAR